MRRFLIEPVRIHAGRMRLTGSEAHHIRHVLRLALGDQVLLMDGQGGEFRSRIVRIQDLGVDLEVIDEQSTVAESKLTLTVGLGILKSNRMDLVIQKGTELGLSALIPLRTERTVVRLDTERAARRVERWREISRQAMKQCRRGRPVDIRPVTDLDNFLSMARADDLKIMLHEDMRYDNKLNLMKILRVNPGRRTASALVGPEGGFTRTEVAQAVDAGFKIVGLGPRILRSETAVMALISILGFELGDLA